MTLSRLEAKCLVASTAGAMQSLLDICYEYGTKIIFFFEKKMYFTQRNKPTKKT